VYSSVRFGALVACYKLVFCTGGLGIRAVCWADSYRLCALYNPHKHALPLTTITLSHAPLLPHTYSYVETEHSKEGTNVQLSVRGKMLPAQVSSAAGISAQGWTEFCQQC
jgi:hypothetical protein